MIFDFNAWMMDRFGAADPGLAADVFRVNFRTARRWVSGEGEVPIKVREACEKIGAVLDDCNVRAQAAGDSF